MLVEGETTEKIIGAAIEVHRILGPGLLESAYEECLARELDLRGIRFRRQVPLSIEYKGVFVRDAYRIDLLVEESVVVELKAVDGSPRVLEAQLMTYLRLGKWRVGLLLNFYVPVMKDGMTRLVN